jgi:hypothetical protein
VGSGDPFSERAAVRLRFRYCDRPLPFPPGQSPFHIKGDFYRQLGISLAHHDARTDGAVTRGLEREGLKDFAGQAFLSSAFYDFLPAPRMTQVVAEVRQRDVYELTAKMGQRAVEAQMQGTYARFLQQLTPANFCARYGQVIRQFYDFGPVTVEPTATGAALVRTGVPLCVAEWWSLTAVPFLTVPLTANGARGVHVEWRIEPTGEQAGGVALGTVHWDIRWEG